MIIEFRVTNFRSFKETQVFSMVAGSFHEHKQTHTFDPELKGFNEKLLHSSAIYGANAAGKTNLLRALQYMQAFVLNSANLADGISCNPFTFSSATRNAPSEFEITFAQNGIRYEYGFAASANQIEKEWLFEFVNAHGRKLFEREYDQKTKEYQWSFSSFLKGQRSLWSKSTRPNTLFLSTAIQLNSKQLIPVFEWFQKRLVVIAGETRLNGGLTLNLFEEQHGKEKILSFMKEADLGIADLEIKREPLPTGAFALPKGALIEPRTGQPSNLVRITFSHLTDDKEYANLDWVEESNGTREFFKIVGAWENFFKTGNVILIDEIETSLHPLLVRFLIEKFHSEKNNPHNAQLLFTTQNPVLLDQELFRRDQIWFVEKDRKGGSKIYPLTDFKPRNDEVLERWYMRGRYGALPIIN